MNVSTKPVKQDKHMFNKLERAKAQLDDDFANWDIGIGSSIGCAPVIEKDYVYFGSCNQYVYCLNKETGEKIWEYKTGNTILSTPYIHNGVLYIGSYDGYLYALTSDTGELIWKFKTGNYIVATPVVYKNMVFFGSLDDYFYCVNIKDGSLKWKHSCPEGSVSTPIIFNGKVVFTAYDKNVWCLNTDTGDVMWKYFMKQKGSATPLLVDEKGNTLANTVVRGPVNVKNGLIIFTTWHGQVYTLDLNGDEIGVFQLANETTGSPLAANKGLYITAYDSNISFTSYDGIIWWRYTTGQSIEATPIVVDDMLYVGSGDQNMYALDAKTGQLKWTFHTGGMVFGSAAYDNGKLYFGSWDGNMYCLDVESRMKVWQFSTGSLGQASILGVDMNDEQERIAFAIQSGMDRDLAYKTLSDDSHEPIGFKPYVGEDERNPYLMVSKDNPYVSGSNRARKRGV